MEGEIGILLPDKLLKFSVLGIFCGNGVCSMENVFLKDYLIRDDNHQFTEFISNKMELYDPTQIDPQSIISSLNELYPNNYEQQKFCLREYYFNCREQIKPYVLMEYYMMQGDYDELYALIELEKERDNPEMRNWTTVYDIIARRQKGELSGTTLIDEIFKVKNTDNETLIFSLIIHLYGISEIGLFEPFHKVRNVIIPMVNLLENEYLRESYAIRLSEMEAMTYLFSNDTESCRRTCLSILQRQELQVYFPLIYANVAHILGKSFIFENYHISKYWLDYSVHSLIHLSGARAKEKIQKISHTVDFLHSFWGINLENIPVDQSEKVHRLLVMGESMEALRLLDEIKQERGYLSSCQLFYYAIAKENDGLLSVAKEAFVSNGNLFFLQLLLPENVQKYKERLNGESN